MRKRKTIKAKEPVRIRFKELANGNKSAYLDIYVDGKRSYEFLKVYLVPEVDEKAKELNEKKLQAIRAIQAQRILEITNGKAGIATDYGKILLVDWLNTFKEMRLESGQSSRRATSIGSAIKHIDAFNKGRKVRLKDVDEKYCKDFVAYLKDAKSRTATKKNKTLSKSSAQSYFVILGSALKEAKRQKLIPSNPMENLSAEDKKVIRAKAAEVGYLTIEELQAMIYCT